MDEREPVVGSWWRYRHARQYRFRFDGRASDGAYRFTRYSESDRETAESTIEIYNLDDMEPSDE